MTFAMPNKGNAYWPDLSQGEQDAIVDCLRYLMYQITFEELAALHPQYIQNEQEEENHV